MHRTGGNVYTARVMALVLRRAHSANYYLGTNVQVQAEDREKGKLQLLITIQFLAIGRLSYCAAQQPLTPFLIFQAITATLYILQYIPLT